MLNNKLSYIEISKSRLIHNINSFRKYIGEDTKIAVVIKANAYGHGQNQVAEAINEYVDYFQVDDAQEFMSLKDHVQKPILILGFVSRLELEEVIKNNAIIAVYDVERLILIERIAQDLGLIAKVHIKIDAALGRQGLLITELEGFINECKKFNNIEFDGVYSHFANIEDTDDFSHAKMQIDIFERAVDMFKNAGFSNVKTHISATSGILVYDKNFGKNNIVRLGLGLYGLWPSDDLRIKYDGHIDMLPVMRWVTHIAQIKTLPKDSTIGYGLTYKTEKPTKIAIIPQGYSDGYDRGFSNNGQVLIGGKRCNVLGRVAMNMFVVDVSGLGDVKVEDEVVILGTQNNETITAEEMADKLSTINYEIVARISPLLPRILM